MNQRLHKLKKQSMEIALAAWIFLAANAVYGVESIVNHRNLDSFSNNQVDTASTVIQSR